MNPLLVESGLFGRGLVPVFTKENVTRYNAALADQGIEPTKLESFKVDGIGWSPEIAAEKGEQAYLNHGDTNQTAIVISPDQEGKPIFIPTHSFERRLMRNLFDRSRREIADITTTNALCLSLEQNLLAYESPKDLLDVQEVIVQAHASGLMRRVREQRDLDAAFTAPGTGWFDPALWDRIIKSSEANDDLRKRRVEVPDMRFSLIGNFWTRAFGGVFVIQSGVDKILVIEDEKLLAKILPQRGERYRAFALSQTRKLTEYLIEEGLVEVDPVFYRTHPEILESLKNAIIVDCVCQAEPDCNIDEMSSSKKKATLLKGSRQSPTPLSELDEFIRALNKEQDKKYELPATLALMLLRPSRATGENVQSILWTLLLRLQKNPYDVLQLYTYDKERFFALFETWPASKQRWAVRHISARYEPAMNK